MQQSELQTLYLAGGCFWGLQAFFARIHGVRETEVGYANGQTAEASYERLKETGHAECLRLVYDVLQIHPAEILLRFFQVIDPLSVDRQGNDCGHQYRTGIYYDTDASYGPAQQAIIQEVCAWQRQQLGQDLAVEVLPLRHFVPAEDYHQHYLVKNPLGYCHIRPSAFKEPLFDPAQFPKPDEADLRVKLSPLQYQVTQEAATERPFSSPYEKSEERGIYVDVVSGEPLFSSLDKFDAGCGWPAFSKPLLQGVTSCQLDRSHGLLRTEVHSDLAQSHLGHLFSDGPSELGGQRYCINGAALSFIPEAEIEAAGYGAFKAFLLPPR